jgi:hypothetical protein
MGTRGLQKCLSEWRRAFLVMKEEENTIFLLTPRSSEGLLFEQPLKKLQHQASFNC